MNQTVVQWSPANGPLSTFLQSLIDTNHHIDFIVPMNYSLNIAQTTSGGCTSAVIVYSDVVETT